MTAIENTAQRLNDFQIKPSHQRIAIMKYLMTVRNHPTAEMVYNTLSPKMPTLSKATVYNTLNLLSANGAIKALTIDATEKRFDGIIEPHGHFQCQICKKIEDIELNGKFAKKLESLVTQHTVLTKDIFLTGICKQCKANTKKRQTH
ncbi:MAG: transcriptional repressor [Rikenellaceae bacterium]